MVVIDGDPSGDTVTVELEAVGVGDLPAFEQELARLIKSATSLNVGVRALPEGSVRDRVQVGLTGKARRLEDRRTER